MRLDASASNGFETLSITKQQAFKLLGSPKIGQRMLFHGWIQVVRQGGRGKTTLLDYSSLKLAYNRWRDVGEPPLLPSEHKGANRKTEKPLLSESQLRNA